MRDFLDAILAFIGSESLTDEEFEGIDLDEPPSYSKEAYEALKAVLESRESVSEQVKRLTLYFKAKGVDLSSVDTETKPVSNIFIGAAL